MDDARDFVFSYNAVSWIYDSGIYIILQIRNQKELLNSNLFDHKLDRKKKRLNIQREY